MLIDSVNPIHKRVQMFSVSVRVYSVSGTAGEDLPINGNLKASVVQ